MRVRTCLAVAALGVAALLAAATARADRATLAPSEIAPWDGGAAVVTPLEALAAKIATRIAGHRVVVRCDPAPLLRESNGVTDAAGMVFSQTDRSTGRYAKTATVIELSATVCSSLQLFAQTLVKPTRCAATSDEQPRPCFTGTEVDPAAAPALCWGSPSTCYSVVDRMSGDYWHLYGGYASAIQTLAHEAIHTAQARKGRLRPRGNLVEQQADCLGMQWAPWVATQLGAGADDAQAIATYYWLISYPAKRTTHPEYWSSACRPGGALDIRAGRAGAWP
jgi:hypothetical protein